MFLAQKKPVRFIEKINTNVILQTRSYTVGFGRFLLPIVTFKNFISYRTVANSAIAK